MRRVILVACVAGKRPELSPAAELYTSTWFVKARDLIEVSGDPWFILSAKHGLLAPDQRIRRYDQTLYRMSARDRRKWADMVQRQMEESLPQADEVVVLAGMRYRDYLMPYLRKRFSRVKVPMKGLRIGEQLRWLDRATKLGLERALRELADDA